MKCNTSCDNDFIFKTFPNECCGKCVATYCKAGDQKFKAGDIWKSADNCTVNECIDTGTGLVVTSYKKSCPQLKHCPQESIEIRDCCPYCNYRSQSEFEFTEIHLKIAQNISTCLFSEILQHLEEIEFTNRDTYRSHPCLRECVQGQPLTCYYEFVVEEYQTMTKACYNCPTNETDCFRPHCISADGMKRTLTVVNRMMPGPSIEVCLNDTVIVDVKNHLMSEGTTIHWHGMHQRKSPYMDGVPYISQCPIPPRQSFRYNFNAENAGTHFWHSHLGLQRGNGVFGAFIVRNPVELHENLYDFDMFEHTLITNDWTHQPANSIFTAHHHGGGDNKPSNILINGRGKYFGNMTATSVATSQAFSYQNTLKNFRIEVKDEIEEEILLTTSEQHETTTLYEAIIIEDEDTTTENEKVIDRAESEFRRPKRALFQPEEESSLVPYEVFTVVKGHRYRFRHINAGFLNCPIELSIDNHTITAIASDGKSLEPLEATFLVTYAGERWDFVINTNQEVGNYFIRARGLMDCDDRFTSSFQLAVLHYHGAPEEDPQDSKPCYKLSREGLTLNALNKPFGLIDSVTVAEMKTIEKRPNHIMKAEPDFKFFLSYDFYGKDNPLFHAFNLYGFNQGFKILSFFHLCLIPNIPCLAVTFGRIYTPQINHITMKMPSTPAMLMKGFQESTFCNETSLAAQGVNCKETFCECTHVLQIPLNSVVEMILIDEGVTYDANHMFHLHGNYFHVVGMDRLGNNVTVEEVKELDKLGRLKRRFVDSPEKDTVTVPDGGYTIIRFFADNPGS